MSPANAAGVVGQRTLYGPLQTKILTLPHENSLVLQLKKRKIYYILKTENICSVDFSFFRERAQFHLNIKENTVAHTASVSTLFVIAVHLSFTMWCCNKSPLLPVLIRHLLLNFLPLPRLCGTKTRTDIGTLRSTSNRMVVLFNSASYYSYYEYYGFNGFEATYEASKTNGI